ncbi:MAG TPA: tetratricopeptide repeat protein, partial [Vicinamibacteria bacterium]
MANQSSTPFDQGLFLVHLNRGREHFDARNFGDASEELEEARKLRPGDDTVLNLLGLAYFKQEKYKEADSVYRKLIELNPESPTLFFNLGLVCFKLSDLDRAEATFLRALELKPENQKAHFYLGNIYEKKKQYYNAIFQYRKAGANIMVKRVQEKIDRERPQERGDGEDFAIPTAAPPPMPAVTDPAPSMDDTRPRIFTAPKAETTAPPFPPLNEVELERVNVDTIDRRRILSAIQQGRFREPRAKTDPLLPRPAPPPPPEPSLEELVGRAVTPSDTQETVLSPEERSVIAEEARGVKATETDTPTMSLPPSSPRPSVGADTTRLRLSEPLVQDESLAEMARRKEPSNASAELFFRQPERGRPAISPPVESLSPGEMADRRSQAQGVVWGGSQPPPGEPHVYARGRRRDDLFRYLEENLLEVNFSGKVFIKQGTIYSYSGNLTFWVKPQRHEGAPPLVIVSGTGKLLLTD